MPSGIVQTRSEYILAYSPNPPRSLSTPPRREPPTLSPSFTGTRRVGPTWTTVPAKSQPMIVPGRVRFLESKPHPSMTACGAVGLKQDVRFQSVGFTAIAATLTRISLSPTGGMGRSSALTDPSGWTIAARYVLGT